VKDKYIDLGYEVKIPLTFGGGTKLAGADTLDFDLSGEKFVSNIDEMTLWIDYENGIQMKARLDIQFLDESKKKIEGIDKYFEMPASSSSSAASKGSFTLKLNKNEADKAKKARDIILKTTLEVAPGENNEFSIRPSNYINLKLSAYSKVNI
jgi:hypothetical protein